MATPTQLSLYNGALFLLGQGSLSSTSEDRETRRALDNVWNRRAIDYCLRQGLWNFAVRTAKFTYDSSISPDFGFPCAFAKPGDWVKSVMIASDDRFQVKLTGNAFRDEAGYWWSDLQELYIRYVSNDSDYGTDYTLWPPDFERFVEAYLAKMGGPRITGVSAERLRTAEAIYDKFEAQAKSADAADDGSSPAPNGTWARSRLSRNSRRDGGVRTSLTS